VLEFDVEGNLLQSWGGPGHAPGWPSSEHTIFVDKQKNVWLGGSGAGDTLLKFTPDGTFISDFGHRGPPAPAGGAKQDNQQTSLLLRGVAAAKLDEDAHEIYIADGYLNKRVIVLDSETGAFKRGWGAYGIPLSEVSNDPAPAYDPSAPPAKQFRGPVHCVQISNDGLVYVCDRGGDRIQVFTKQGKFVKEFYIAKTTLERGSAGSVSFSPDREQRYLFVADIMNNVVWILNRSDGTVAGRIGRTGHAGGQFHWVHVAATDSHGNVYTGEVDSGKRIQKFVPVD
jgi:DNA-binding beta-propeller fold protein YncE